VAKKGIRVRSFGSKPVATSTELPSSLLDIETGEDRMGENLKQRIIQKKRGRNVKERLERILMLAEGNGLVTCLVKNNEIFKCPYFNCLSSTNP
jgi:glycosyltransferase A (GT-A) superfamily protein (DUF2064 family)